MKPERPVVVKSVFDHEKYVTQVDRIIQTNSRTVSSLQAQINLLQEQMKDVAAMCSEMQDRLNRHISRKGF